MSKVKDEVRKIIGLRRADGLDVRIRLITDKVILDVCTGAAAAYGDMNASATYSTARAAKVAINLYRHICHWLNLSESERSETLILAHEAQHVVELDWDEAIMGCFIVSVSLAPIRGNNSVSEYDLMQVLNIDYRIRSLPIPRLISKAEFFDEE